MLPASEGTVVKISTETEAVRVHGKIGERDWRDEEIGVGVSRCPIDPDDYGAFFGRRGLAAMRAAEADA